MQCATEHPTLSTPTTGSNGKVNLLVRTAELQSFTTAPPGCEMRTNSASRESVHSQNLTATKNKQLQSSKDVTLLLFSTTGDRISFHFSIAFLRSSCSRDHVCISFLFESAYCIIAQYQVLNSVRYSPPQVSVLNPRALTQSVSGKLIGVTRGNRRGERESVGAFSQTKCHGFDGKESF